jgi:hypothetical protein
MEVRRLKLFTRSVDRIAPRAPQHHESSENGSSSPCMDTKSRPFPGLAGCSLCSTLVRFECMEGTLLSPTICKVQYNWYLELVAMASRVATSYPPRETLSC